MREEIAAQFEGLPYPKLADEVVRLNAEIKRLKDEEKRVRQVFDVLTTEVIPDKLAEDGFRSVNLADGSQLKLSSQAYCSTRAGMKGALFKWLMDNNFEDLITEVVNPGTLKSFIKEQLSLGNPVPDDEIINYQPYSRASIVGRKD